MHFETVGAISDLIREDRSKFFVYSTYAKSYLSKISTTYGLYMDKTIYQTNLCFKLSADNTLQRWVSPRSEI